MIRNKEIFQPALSTSLASLQSARRRTTGLCLAENVSKDQESSSDGNDLTKLSNFDRIMFGAGLCRVENFSKDHESSSDEEDLTKLTNFDRIVRKQADQFKPKPMGETESALHQYWRNKGLKEEVHRKRVVTACLEWWKEYQTPGYCTSILCLLNVLEARFRQLKTLLPRASIAKMLWKQPMMLHIDLCGAACRIAALCHLMPGVNVVRLLEKDPSLLLRADIVAATEEGILSLHTLLPRADVLRMVERHPSLLFRDVKAGLMQLRAQMPDKDVEQMVEKNPILVLKHCS